MEAGSGGICQRSVDLPEVKETQTLALGREGSGEKREAEGGSAGPGGGLRGGVGRPLVQTKRVLFIVSPGCSRPRTAGG